MDSHGSVDQTIQAAVKEFDTGNYRGALALLLPLLREKEAVAAAGAVCGGLAERL
jgi:hypothetical protein